MEIWRSLNPILKVRSWKPPLTEEEKAARKEKTKRKKVKSEDGDDESQRLLSHLRTWKCRYVSQHIRLDAHTFIRSRKQKKVKKAKKDEENEP